MTLRKQLRRSLCQSFTRRRSRRQRSSQTRKRRNTNKSHTTDARITPRCRRREDRERKTDAHHARYRAPFTRHTRHQQRRKAQHTHGSAHQRPSQLLRVAHPTHPLLRYTAAPPHKLLRLTPDHRIDPARRWTLHPRRNRRLRKSHRINDRSRPRLHAPPRRARLSQNTTSSAIAGGTSGYRTPHSVHRPGPASTPCAASCSSTAADDKS